MQINEFGQPVGDAIPTWSVRPLPGEVNLAGERASVVTFTDEHLTGLFVATCGPENDRLWTYMSTGPFEAVEQLAEYLGLLRERAHPVAIVVGGKVAGIASYLNAVPANGSIEVGHITYGPILAGTRAATEAMYLMARHAFDDLGYRRYEWKCDSLNTPSRRAALRLGFLHEGTFSHHVVTRGRNRDTSWFAITDDRWPAVRNDLERWLTPGNFDESGRQRQSLGALLGTSRTDQP